MEGKKSKAVVVGGGVAGAYIAKILQFDTDLVLIDPKEYYEIAWAEMRAKVEPSFAERSIINHREYLTNGRLVTSAAIEVRTADVLVEDSHLIPYDYLVIATGHRDSVPRTRSDRLSQFQADNQKIKDSKSVLITGGGPSGVELAGEIAVDYPDKKVTLVHQGSRLMEFIGHKASTKSLDWLTSRKVEVLLGQTVNINSMSEAEHVFKTSSGETISADCHFKCIGRPLGSSWLRESMLKESLDGNGRVMVDEHLRVKGHDNIFAIGDITNIDELKQGYIAHKHAEVVAKNLKKLLVEGKESKLTSYKPGFSMALVSLGRKDGLAHFPCTTISGRLPGMIKSKDLFVGKTRKQMGLNPNGN